MSLKYQVEYYGTHLMYSRHDRLHRIKHPAIVCKNGSLYWFQYSERHRADGPAEILGEDKSKSYYIRGLRYSLESYESKIRS